MTVQLILTKPFPIDILVLLGVALVAGAGWFAGGWLMAKVLR